MRRRKPRAESARVLERLAKTDYTPDKIGATVHSTTGGIDGVSQL